MNIVFMGTPRIAQQVIESIEEYVNITAVYTRPDKPSGRGKKEQYSPVKQHALERGYPIEQPHTLRTQEAIDRVAYYQPTCIIVIAYGALLPQAILDIPRYGAINIHGSLLPHYRGAAPIQRALWNGETTTGATIMQLDAGMDTGDILLNSSFPIEHSDTTYTVMEKMAHIGSRALLRTLCYYMIIEEHPKASDEEIHLLVQQHPLYRNTLSDTIIDHVLSPHKQDSSLASYAPKITREEEYIIWSNSAQQVHNQIQALSYSNIPTASTLLYRENKTPLRVKIPLGTYKETDTHHAKAGSLLGISESMLHVACGTGIYCLPFVRPENKKDISAHDFYNGYCKGEEAYFNQ